MLYTNIIGFGKKNKNALKSDKKWGLSRRSLHLEPLEERAMLAVGPMDFSAFESPFATPINGEERAYVSSSVLENQDFIDASQFGVTAVNDFLGTEDNDWFNVANWSLSHVPTNDETAVLDSNDLVVINNPSGVTCNIVNDGSLIFRSDNQYTYGSISGTGSIELDITSGYAFTFYGEIEAGSLALGNNNHVTFRANATISDSVTSTGASSFTVSSPDGLSNVLVTFDGTVDIDGAALTVNDRATFSLPGLTSYDVSEQSNSSNFNVNGASSVLDLSHLTTFTASSGHSLNLYSSNGGTLDLSGITTFGDQAITLQLNGDHSAIDLSALADNTTLYNTNLNLTGENLSILGFENVVGMVSGAVYSYRGTHTLSHLATLTNVSLHKGGSGSLSLPRLTSYTWDTATSYEISARYGKIDLPALTEITMAENLTLNIDVYNGGKVNLAALTKISGRNVSFSAYGEVSFIDASALGSFAGGTGTFNIDAAAGAKIDLSALETIDATNVYLYVSSAGSELNLSALKTINAENASLDVTSAGSVLNLSLLESIVCNSGTIYVSGEAAVLSLPSLTTLTTILENYSLNLYSSNGGTLDLSGITTFGDQAINLQLYGDNSTINLTGLADNTTLYNTNLNLNGENLSILGFENVIDMDSGAVYSYRGTHTLDNLTSLTNVSLYKGDSGSLSLPRLTSYTWDTATSSYEISARYGKIDLPALTEITMAEDLTLDIDVYNGGKVNLSALTEVNTDLVNFYAHDAGSFIDVSALASFTKESGSFNASARNGAQIDLSALKTINTEQVSLDVISADSVLNLSLLESIVCNSGMISVNGENAVFSLPLLSTLTILKNYPFNLYSSNGGTLDLSGITTFGDQAITLQLNGDHSAIDLTGLTDTTLYNMNIYLTGENLSILGFENVIGMVSGAVYSYRGTHTLDNLTSLSNVTLHKSGNETDSLSLSNLTSYTWDTATSYEISAWYGKIDLPALTEITMAENLTLDIDVYVGGKVILPLLTEIIGGNVNFNAQDTGSFIDVSALASFTKESGSFDASASHGAKIDLAALKTINTDHVSLYVSHAGSGVNLPLLESIVCNSGSIHVTEESAVLSLPSLSTLTTNLENYPFNLYSSNGGTLDLSGITTFGDQAINLQLYGDNSTINLTGLADNTTLYNTNLILNGENLSILGFENVIGMVSGAITSYAGTHTLSHLATLTNVSLYKGGNVTDSLSLPRLTSYTWDTATTYEMYAHFGNIDLPALTEITMVGDLTFYVVAYVGSKVNLSSLTKITGGNAIFYANGKGTLIDASSLFLPSDRVTEIEVDGGIVELGTLASLTNLTLGTQADIYSPINSASITFDHDVPFDASRMASVFRLTKDGNPVSNFVCTVTQDADAKHYNVTWVGQTVAGNYALTIDGSALSTSELTVTGSQTGTWTIAATPVSNLTLGTQADIYSPINSASITFDHDVPFDASRMASAFRLTKDGNPVSNFVCTVTQDADAKHYNVTWVGQTVAGSYALTIDGSVLSTSELTVTGSQTGTWTIAATSVSNLTLGTQADIYSPINSASITFDHDVPFDASRMASAFSLTKDGNPVSNFVCTVTQDADAKHYNVTWVGQTVAGSYALTIDGSVLSTSELTVTGSQTGTWTIAATPVSNLTLGTQADIYSPINSASITFDHDVPFDASRMASAFSLTKDGNPVSNFVCTVTQDADAKHYNVTWVGQTVAGSYALTIDGSVLSTSELTVTGSQTGTWTIAATSVSNLTLGTQADIYSPINSASITFDHDVPFDASRMASAFSLTKDGNPVSNFVCTVTQDADAKHYNVTWVGQTVAGSYALTIDGSVLSTSELTVTGSQTGTWTITATSDSGETPSTIVTTLSDIVDAKDGLISLREAIAYATSQNNVITFDPSLTSDGSKTINLALGEFVITRGLTIEGSNITINAAQKSRHMTIKAPNQEVLINDITFTNGKIAKDGGAVYLDNAILVMNGVVFKNNEATGKSGGAFYQKAGSVVFVNATFDDNTGFYGGAFYQKSGTSAFENALLTGNDATYGGAFYLANGTATLSSNTQFTSNNGKWGGAIYLQNGTLAMTDNVLTNNKSTWGGAIYQSNGQLSLDHVTLSKNKSTWGGGLYQSGGDATLKGTVIVSNTGSGKALVKSKDAALTIKSSATGQVKILETALNLYLDEIGNLL